MKIISFIFFATYALFLSTYTLIFATYAKNGKNGFVTCFFALYLCT